MNNPILEAGGPWVRADHIVQCEEYPNTCRPYHLEMPVLTESLAEAMSYEIGDGLAICIPVALTAPASVPIPW